MSVYILNIMYIIYTIHTYTQHSCVVFDTKEEHFLKMWSKDRLGIQEMDQQLRVLAGLQET